MMSFTDFVLKYFFLKKTTSKLKIYQVLLLLALSDVGIFLREGTFECDIAIVNLHLKKGTHWVP